MHATLPLLVATDFPPIRRRSLDTLQMNLGYKCNQSCLHCHVAASPQHTEMMDGDTVALALEVLRHRRVRTLDLTGGAPELNEHFRHLVRQARKAGVRVVDRCNLTTLSEPGQEDLAEVLAEQGRGHRVTALLFTRQRRPSARRRRLRAQHRRPAPAQRAGLWRPRACLRERPGAEPRLQPQGDLLPPLQGPLEADYKRELLLHFGIRFDHLFALTNMPIQRFGSTVVGKGSFVGYMKLHRDSYRAENLDTVMCRNLLSVDWQRFLYDCDFNQMLGLRASLAGLPRPLLRDLLRHDPTGADIRIAHHCYGCTAGQGSSCGGALEGADAPEAEAVPQVAGAR